MIAEPSKSKRPTTSKIKGWKRTFNRDASDIEENILSMHINNTDSIVRLPLSTESGPVHSNVRPDHSISTVHC